MATISLVEAAARLNLATSTLRHQIKNKKFKAFKIGRDWATTEREVEKYREKHALPADEALRYKNRKRPSN